MRAGRCVRSRAGGGPARPGAGRASEAAGAVGAGGREAEGLGSTMTSSASRAGGCTICGATSWAGPVAPGGGGWPGGPAGGVTETQPDTAVTAKPTRS